MTGLMEDLLQLHSCTEENLRQGEVIEVVKRACDASKTRFIGYSLDSHAALYATGVFDPADLGERPGSGGDRSGDSSRPLERHRDHGQAPHRQRRLETYFEPDAYYQLGSAFPNSTMTSSAATSRTPSPPRFDSRWRFPEFIRLLSEQLNRTAGVKTQNF